MLFEIFEEKFTNVNGGEGGKGARAGCGDADCHDQFANWSRNDRLFGMGAPICTLVLDGGFSLPQSAPPTAPSSEGAKGGRLCAGAESLPRSGAPARGAGTALAVTEGAPGLRECQWGKEKAI